RFSRDWSSDVCSSDLAANTAALAVSVALPLSAEGVIVVAVAFTASQGPSAKAKSASVQLVWLARLSVRGRWSGWVRYSTSADCADRKSGVEGERGGRG